MLTCLKIPGENTDACAVSVNALEQTCHPEQDYVSAGWLFLAIISSNFL